MYRLEFSSPNLVVQSALFPDIILAWGCHACLSVPPVGPVQSPRQCAWTLRQKHIFNIHPKRIINSSQSPRYISAFCGLSRPLTIFCFIFFTFIYCFLIFVSSRMPYNRSAVVRNRPGATTWSKSSRKWGFLPIRAPAETHPADVPLLSRGRGNVLVLVTSGDWLDEKRPVGNNSSHIPENLFFVMNPAEKHSGKL